MGPAEKQETERPEGINRRALLGWAGAGAGGALLVGVTAATTWPGGAVAGAAQPSPSAPEAAEHGPGDAGSVGDAEMNAHHQEGVDAFLANRTSPITEGVGAVELPWRMEDGVRVFELTCQAVEWEVTPGQREQALTYNGIVPGPTLRMVEGQPVRVQVRNELDQSTSVHWHGQRVPNDMDGVTFLTQPPIEPGAEFTYEFVPSPYGSHMYHSHHNAAEQVGKGMLGALIVEPAERSAEPAYDRD